MAYSQKRGGQLAALAVAAATMLSGGCRSTKPPRSTFDAATEIGATGPDSPPGQSCGDVAASGTTPAGDFTASRITVEVNRNLSTSCTSYTASVTIYDDNAGSSLGFTVQIAAAQPDAAVLVGPQTTYFFFSTPKAVAMTRTSGSVVVTTVDHPHGAATAPDASLTGGITASFSLSLDGFAIGGSFSAQYCQLAGCFDTG